MLAKEELPLLSCLKARISSAMTNTLRPGQVLPSALGQGFHTLSNTMAQARCLLTNRR